MATNYDEIRAGLVPHIHKARVMGDHRVTVIMCRRFCDAFPSGKLAPIEEAVRTVFLKTLEEAKDQLTHVCPVCGTTMYDSLCPDDVTRAHCAKCGKTYTPIGYDCDNNYALKWHAILWDGGAELREVIEVR